MEVAARYAQRSNFAVAITYQLSQSIYGGKFNDDKDGLKRKMQRGSLAMANSGKNTNSSQFFIVLTDDEAKLSKINGKYVVFGEVESGLDVLDRLDEVGGGPDGKSSQPIWIGDCGVC
jgi:cyclophilin family peptidyl-prolyl cis-trans isomerase